MTLPVSLFEGSKIRLAPIDYEKDPPVEAGWTNNPLFLRMMSVEPARPLSPAQVKKRYEEIEKQSEEGRSLIHFAIRTRPEPAEQTGEQGTADGRLIGYAEFYWIEWHHRSGWLRLGIGSPQDWGKGYGKEALRLLLRYGFDEINLRRIGAVIPEYNTPAIYLAQSAGFVEEVRRREAIHRDGRRWDLLHFGLLQSEWKRS